ncbi:hypothetical protein [Streptomyces sp. NPDC048623]|uniref:hypothetical protein n=1 Tax=Streptomyces sp. NPDC048623 TaxID=3155761 RepID=UPI00343027C0
MTTSAFDLDVWVKESRREPFRFTVSGHLFEMPSAGELDKSILRKVNVDNPSAQDIDTLLCAGLGTEWPIFEEIPLPLGALGELFRRWQAHEGVPLGESSASAGS